MSRTPVHEETPTAEPLQRTASAPGAAAPARPRGGFLAKLAAAALGVLVTLLVAEAAIRVVAPQRLNGMWRLITPRGYPVNRAGGEIRFTGPGGPVTYRFNDRHLRGGPLVPGARRVLCLGDSFTFGHGLAEEDTYVARLQAKADERFGPGALQMLNGGFCGWGADDYVAFVEDFGESIAPAAVVVFLSSWDVGRAVQGGPFVLKSADPPQVAPSDAPVEVAGEMRLLAESSLYQWLLQNSHLAQFVHVTAVRVRSAQVATWTPQKTADAAMRADLGAPMGMALFRRLAAWCEAHGTALWVVTTGRPDEGSASDSSPARDEATIAFKRVAPAFFAALHVPYADLAPEVAKSSGGDFKRLEFADDLHPSPKGAAVIADAAWRHLEPLLASLPRQARPPR